MTNYLSFTMDSFQKRKELLHLFYIQVFIAIVLYYIIVLSEVLIHAFYQTTVTNLINYSISSYWGSFFLILIMIAIVFTSILVLFTIRLMIFYQTKDISVMIAVGGITEIIENFYLTQLLLMCLVSGVTGIIVAYITVIIIIIFSDIFLPLKLSLSITFPDPFLIIIFLIFFFSTYLISGRLVSNIVKKYHEDLIQDKIDFNNGTDNNIIARTFIWGKKNADGFIKLTTRISRLNIMRHSFVFLISLIINLLYAFFLISVVFGTVLVSDTTTNIAYSGIGGDNTAMVVNKNYVQYFKEAFYLDSTENFYNVSLQNSFFNYASVLPVLKAHNISHFDDRIIVDKNITVRNYPTSVDPTATTNNGGPYLGSVAETNAMIVALNISQAIPSWHYNGANPKQLSGNSIFAGQQFAYHYYKDPFNGDFYFSSNSKIQFSIKSIVMDPLFKGNAVYIPTSTYLSMFKLNKYQRNMILIKVPHNTNVNQLASAIQSVNSNLTVYSLNSVLNHNSNFNTFVSSYLLLVAIPLFIVYFILTDSYTKQIIEERRPQLNLIKILGGDIGTYRSVILKEIDSFSLWGLTIGYVGAMFFLIQMTVPFPVVTPYAVLFSIAVLVIPYFIIRRRLIGKINDLYNTFVEE